DSLGETVARCHRAGAKVYLTLNTLVFEDELELAARSIIQAAEGGVDALIVQDPAVALMARKLAPTLELHASTQMTISSAEGARFAQRLGITRVVVPRELSVTEIADFAAHTTLELEVFVHGALCVSWSGQCLTSEAWSGRSANRGQCAQSCRMPYDLVLDGDLRHDEDLSYLLSPRDLAGFGALPSLLATGVHGLKIEGRQKSPQYVATATAGYRGWVDALLADPTARERLLAELPERLRDLSVSYSRGFSEGFLSGINHQTLVEGRFPKHRGLLLGRVEHVHQDAVIVRRESRPHELAAAPALIEPGQGVVFDQGDPEDKQEPGGPVFRVEETKEGLRLGFGHPGPDLDRVRPGDRVWITSDPKLAREQRRHVEGDEPHGRNPIRLRVSGSEGVAMTVEATTDRHESVTLSSQSALAPARGVGLDEALLREKLGSFGGTPFRVGELDQSAFAPGLHLPVSELKALRRGLTEGLESKMRCRGHAISDLPIAGLIGGLRRDANRAPANQRLLHDDLRIVPLIRSMEQLEAVIELGLPEVEIDWMELVGLSRAVTRARAAGLQTTIASLRVQKPGEDGFGSALEQ
ncbi:MAG: U32 family peptidase, partial [Planctomycetes bacterium]|nr:U32 family peptidase [Planctomycetota bacterium]